MVNLKHQVMKTNQIAEIILKALCDRNYKVFLTHAQLHHMHEADVFGITGAEYMVEYEIKTSRADFKADFKKGVKAFMVK